MSYHASTWPLAVPPCADELLGFLDRDHSLSPLSSDDELSRALREAGHDPPSTNDHSRRVRDAHRVRRHEAQTGLPF